jgi:glutamyl-tRNA reductase
MSQMQKSSRLLRSQAAREQEEAARRAEEARRREVERLQREIAEQEAEEVRKIMRERGISVKDGEARPCLKRQKLSQKMKCKQSQDLCNGTVNVCFHI